MEKISRETGPVSVDVGRAGRAGLNQRMTSPSATAGHKMPMPLERLSSCGLLGHMWPPGHLMMGLCVWYAKYCACMPVRCAVRWWRILDHLLWHARHLHAADFCAKSSCPRAVVPTSCSATSFRRHWFCGSFKALFQFRPCAHPPMPQPVRSQCPRRPADVFVSGICRAVGPKFSASSSEIVALQQTMAWI